VLGKPLEERILCPVGGPQGGPLIHAGNHVRKLETVLGQGERGLPEKGLPEKGLHGEGP